MREQLRAISPTILPASVVGIAYLVCLGHRHDYLGHYAAGFGATLAALAIAMEKIPESRFAERSPIWIFSLTLACIAAGAYAEATGFNIAKFDEVDFCNQSLGAVLAGLGLLANSGASKPDGNFLRAECYAGLVFLHVGFYFAMF
jgi:hypothetical protein